MEVTKENRSLKCLYRVIDARISRSYANYIALKIGVSKAIVERSEEIYLEIKKGKDVCDIEKSNYDEDEINNYLYEDKKGDVPEVDYSHLPPPVLEGLQLNKEQSDAFHMSLPGFAVKYIQTPCGTGKTVVAGVIANSVDEIVFLTAETNKSVDNLAESAHKQSLGSRNVIRYYSPGHEMTLKETLTNLNLPSSKYPFA
uniref:Helicase ATP-binding domain-containing protein n=1 Tax=Rhabditophanes sp. KR3021 TaxID=114890 RepID=A0AC35U136_9BILA